jgi:1,4-alpha-glucan branching enzyme
MQAQGTVLLGLLARGALYGYELERELALEPLAQWADATPEALYDALAALEADGLVILSGQDLSRGRPSRVRYQITPAGRATLQATLVSVWQTPGSQESEDLAILFLDALDTEELVAALSQREAALQAELDRWEQAQRQQEERYGLRPTLRVVTQRAQARLQSEIAWIKELAAEVQQGAFVVSHPRPSAVDPSPPAPRAPFARRRNGRGQGAFTFVLHTHLPYCRMAGRWPHGEEWLHEAMAETYVPLLNALYDLRAEGVPFRLTMSLTPVLTEQLADADVRDHFVQFLDEEILAAESDIPRFGEEQQPYLQYLAGFYRDTYTHLKDSFLNRFGGDLIGAFRQLQDEGYLEIVTCGATHGYLPLLSRDSSIYGQLRAAVESYRQFFGRAPRAIWLPECAYRPAYVDGDGVTRPAIEEFLAGLGITCFFVETHAIEGGQPVGKAAGDVAIGPYTPIQRKYVLPAVTAQAGQGTTFAAYYVIGNAVGLTDPPVAAIGRNNRTGQQVWSGQFGYPGDADYREFHQKDHESGLQYWRVTGPGVDLGAKDAYHPEWAAQRVVEHARHYAALVESLISDYHTATGKYPILASNYDTELFGHWWFEGIEWIKQVLLVLAQSDKVDLTTASGYLAENPPEQALAIPESSWGSGGTHWTWDNPDTHALWAPIHAAERRMEALVQRYPEAQGSAQETLAQAARELLLLQSSDWPFLVTTGQAKEYATERFESHVARFTELAALAEAGDWERGAARSRELYELDKLFPTIDYRWFRARQGQASALP